MIKKITNRLFLLVTMLLLSTVNVLAQDVIETAYGGGALPDAPTKEGNVWNVTAENAQYVLDGAYGSIDGKTINFTESISKTLEFGRPTKYTGSNSKYYRHAFGTDQRTLDFMKDNQGKVVDGDYSNYYTRSISNVKFTADKGVTLNGFHTHAGGHAYGANVYDCVIDYLHENEGSVYYFAIAINGVTFDGITFTGRVNNEVSSANGGAEMRNFTFKNCTFNIGKTDADEYTAIRHYSEGKNDYIVSDLVVKDCVFNTVRQGVYTMHVQNITVDGCTFNTTGHNAVAVQNQAVYNHGKVVITDNTGTKIGDRAIRLNEVGSNTQFTITGNNFTIAEGKSEEWIKATSLAEGITYNVANNTWTNFLDAYNEEFRTQTPSVAQIGTVKYATLQAAVDAASANDVIELLKDFDLTTVTTNPSNKYNVEINKSITIDGKGYKITSSQGKRALVLTGKGNNITLKDLTVINNKADATLWIADALTCTLDKTVIDGTDAVTYNQPVTIGQFSDADRVVLNVTNGSVIKTNDDAKAHYAIIAWHPADIDVTESTIKGWAAVYVKPDAAGTNVSISNSTLESHGYSGVSNAFGMFVTESDGNSFTLTNNSYKLTPEDNYDVLLTLNGHKNNTIQLLGSNNNFVSSDSHLGGLTFSWGDFYANSLYMSEEAKNLFEDYIDSDCTIGQVAEGTYAGLYKINYIPQVYYYWNTDNGPKGVYSSFADPFTGGWLANGEFITINKDFALTSNIACQLTSGSFTLTQGEYSITKGEYAVTLNGGVSVITDKQTDIFAAAEGYKIQETVSGNTYTYKAVAAVVAQIGSVKYETLAEAFNAAKNGETITLLADCETGSNYDISKPLKIAYTGTTLDLNGKTLTVTNNFSFCVTASNVTVKNGTIASGVNTQRTTNLNSYILVIGGGEKEETISGVTIENVKTQGGISVGGDSDAGVKGIAKNTVIKDCDVLSGDYYAVCSQNESTVTINGGKYTANPAKSSSKVLYAAFKGHDGPEGKISVVAGTFTGAITNDNQNYISISGGTYSVDPNAFVAEGYEAVKVDDVWKVGEVVVTGELTPETGATETKATYTVPATVKDGKTEIGPSANAGKKVTVEIAEVNNAATGATLEDLNIANVLTKAITTEAAAGQNNINVSIAVVAEDPAQAALTYTYEVYPQATVTVGEATPVKVKLANSDLADGASFTFTLNVNGKFADKATVQVVHISDEFGTTTLPELFVVDGDKVTISEIEHFSRFQLSEVIPASISDVGFATFSSTKAVDFTGIDAIHAYTAAMNGNRIEFTRIKKVPANTGLLIRNPSGAKGVSVGVPVIENFEPGENDYDLKNNALVAVTENDIAVLYDEDGDYSNYILNKVNNVVGFYRPGGEYGVAKGRAYLQVSTSSVSGVQSFTNLFDGETTAIDSITTADEQTQDNVFYDLSGRRVNNPQRGLYIVNGKKVLVK